jgi:hypothetical protein
MVRYGRDVASPLSQGDFALSAPLLSIHVSDAQRFKPLGPGTSRAGSGIVDHGETLINESGVDQSVHDSGLDKVEVLLAACDQL